MKNCCLNSIECEHCSCLSSVQLQRPVFVQKILKITVLLLYIATTEGCLLYLSSINVVWRKDFSSFDVNRIVAWLSLATTLLITFAMTRSGPTELSPQNPNVCHQCKGRLTLGRKVNPSKRSWSNLIYIDFMHCFFVAVLMLYCAFGMIVDIPQDYDHHMEVGLKLLGFVLDASLSLLFTKSCIDAYTALEGSPTRCLCENDDLVMWEKTGQCNSTTPSSGEESSSEDGDRTALLMPRTGGNKIISYKKISS